MIIIWTFGSSYTRIVSNTHIKDVEERSQPFLISQFLGRFVASYELSYSHIYCTQGSRTRFLWLMRPSCYRYTSMHYIKDVGVFHTGISFTVLSAFPHLFSALSASVFSYWRSLTELNRGHRFGLPQSKRQDSNLLHLDSLPRRDCLTFILFPVPSYWPIVCSHWRDEKPMSIKFLVLIIRITLLEQVCHVYLLAIIGF